MRSRSLLNGLTLAVVSTSAVAAMAGVATPASAATAVTAQSNITYYVDNGAPQQLDAYTPAVKPKASPAVIFVHGGGWAGGDKSKWGTWPQQLATNSGWPVFNINYVLNSSNPAWEEYWVVAQAIAWVKAHASTYGIDPNRIGLIGESAGGQLSQLAGTFPAATSPQYRVKTVVSLSGIADLPLLATDANCLTLSCLTQDGTLVRYAASLAEANLTKVPYALSPATWVNASPVTYVGSDDASMFLVNSSDELIPTDQVTRMATALQANGVPVTQLIVPGSAHGVDLMPTVAGQVAGYLGGHL